MLQPNIFMPSEDFSLGGHKPFDFQLSLVKEFYQAVQEGERNILLCAGTGSGKTFMSAMILARESQSTRCVFLVDLNCLIEQAIAEFKALGINCAAFQGSQSLTKKGKFRLQMADVIVASIQTLGSRRKKQSFAELLGERIGLFIADECHTVAFSQTYSALRAEYPEAIFLGLSATIKTQGSGDRFLGRFYKKVLRSPSMPEMIRLGRCVPFRLFSPSGIIDVSTLRIDDKTGDYDLQEQDEQIDAHGAQVVESWKKHGDSRPTAAYCPTIHSATQLATAFMEAGVRTEVCDASVPLGIDGRYEHAMGIATRAAQNYRLSTGIIKVVCSVGTQVKGWNMPSLGCVIILRATKSLHLWLQIAGRGGRTCLDPYWCQGQKQDCLLLDFGSNLERFHPISPNNFGTRKSDYDISEIVFGRESSSGDRRIRENPSGTAEEEEENVGVENLDLYEWFDISQVSQIAFLRKAKRSAYDKKLSPNEGEREFLKEYGFLPYKEWHEGAVFGPFSKKSDRQAYADYLKPFAPNDYWAQVQLNLEFGSGKPKGKIKDKLPWHRVLGVSPRTTKGTAYNAYRKRRHELVQDMALSNSERTQALGILDRAWGEAQKFLKT